MNDTPRKRLSLILAQFIAPVLAKEGFRRQRLLFTSDHGDVTWVVEVRHSRWNDAAHLQFTIECGIHVPGVVETYNGMDPQRGMHTPMCCVHARPAMLDDGYDKWWNLNPDEQQSVDGEIGAQIQTLLLTHAFPFLRRFCTIRDVIEFLRTPRRGNERYVWPQNDAIATAYYAVLEWLYGDRVLATQILDRVISGEKETPVNEHLRLLRTRLSPTA